MSLAVVITHRLVKSEDLNHHKTLFAGRCAEWFVESSFVAVAKRLNPEFIVCLKVHGLEFLKPIHAGDILTFESKIVANGRSSLHVFTRVFQDDKPDRLFCDGFATFVYVDEKTVPRSHHIEIIPETEEEILLNQEAKNLLLKSRRSN